MQKRKETPEQRAARLAYGAAYRQANRNEINAKAAEYRAANRERCYAITKEWHEKHPERLKEIKRKNYQRNRERYYLNNRAFVKANPEKASRYQRRYFEKNRDVILKKIAAWHAANPASRIASFHKRRAQKLAAVMGDQKQLRRWVKIIREKKSVKCNWCGKRLSGSQCHIDHVVPLSRGGAHSIENLCASCPACNQKKFTKDPGQFNSELSQPLLFV